jgi:hypothetical protein
MTRPSPTGSDSAISNEYEAARPSAGGTAACEYDCYRSLSPLPVGRGKNIRLDKSKASP